MIKDKRVRKKNKAGQSTWIKSGCWCGIWLMVAISAVHLCAITSNADEVKDKVTAVVDVATSAPAAASYRIGIGDLLLIAVWKDDSLTRQVQVLPDGTISFPLLGEIHAEGLTLPDLRDLITERLGRFITDVRLSVQVLQLNSQVVYVIGKVNRPGHFGLFSNINVLQALASAGGLNPFAKSGSIRIFRETDKGTQILLFDYDEVAKGENLAQNIRLERGDVIVVP